VQRKFFYEMKKYTIDAETLGSWAGFAVFIKIEDEVSGPNGFLAIDNIKYHGAPYQCVGLEAWTAYTTVPIGGHGNNQGWSRSNGAYYPGTSSPCEKSHFWNGGTDGSCEYASCPAGAVTTTQGLCRGDSSVCKFPSESATGQWPTDCPCVKV
jgi:hypothetical protein